MTQAGSAENRAEARRRRRAHLIWRVGNPLLRPLSGWAPWWVELETTGRRSGLPRRVPLARGPRDGDVLWLLAVHGRGAAFARNIEAEPRVRVRIGGRWQTGRAQLLAMDAAVLARFSRYARLGPQTLGIDPLLVRVELDPDG